MGKKTYTAIALLLLIGSGFGQMLPPQPGISSLGTDTIYTPDIIKGDTVEAVFYFQNNASIPFVIWQVHPGCQCTAPQYPSDTIMPGRQDSITLMFYSRKTDEEKFEKYAIMLTAVGEKTYYLKGNMRIRAKEEAVKNKRIRITNRTRYK